MYRIFKILEENKWISCERSKYRINALFLRYCKLSIAGLMVNSFKKIASKYKRLIRKSLQLAVPENFLLAVRNNLLNLLINHPTSLKPVTANTITDKNQLIKEIEQVRSESFSITRQQAHENLCCMASPVFEYNDEVRSGVSPKIITEEQMKRWGSLLADMTQEIYNHSLLKDKNLLIHQKQIKWRVLWKSYTIKIC